MPPVWKKWQVLLIQWSLSLYTPWFLVKVEVCDEMIVDSSLLSSFTELNVAPLWPNARKQELSNDSERIRQSFVMSKCDVFSSPNEALRGFTGDNSVKGLTRSGCSDICCKTNPVWRFKYTYNTEKDITCMCIMQDKYKPHSSSSPQKIHLTAVGLQLVMFCCTDQLA